MLEGSYYLRKMLSLCVLDVDLNRPGPQVEIIRCDCGETRKSRGYICVDTFHDGLYILRCTV